MVFESENQRILGEVKDIAESDIQIKFLGEFQGEKYIPGVLK